MDRTSLADTNTLVLYNETQTFTSTVHEHLAGFARFSRARVFFAHQDVHAPVSDLALFDTVIIHYSIRLPFDQIAEETARALEAFGGLKVLFIQDEYDHTHRAWHWIKRLGVKLVFSSVPAVSMHRVYPPEQLPGVRFVSNLTGYAPEALGSLQSPTPPSQRALKIGYRGRPLPIRYGALGQEKVEIGRMVKAYCESAGVAHDIAWEESDRLYGDAWYDFIRSCRAVLGTESGANVFDWDGTLPKRIADYRRQHRRASDAEVYDAVIAPLEQPGLMNQVSARVFEAIACRTALVLFEGDYSGVVAPERHFISLRKDGSNLTEVIERLRDGQAVDAMTERAYAEVLASGRFAHDAFVRLVDDEIIAALGRLAPAPVAVLRPVARPLVSRSWPLQYLILPPRHALLIVRLVLKLFPAWSKDLVKRILHSLVPPRQ
jgi:hypothetical protein